jgi:hypothetical protein
MGVPCRENGGSYRGAVFIEQYSGTSGWYWYPNGYAGQNASNICCTGFCTDWHVGDANNVFYTRGIATGVAQPGGTNYAYITEFNPASGGSSSNNGYFNGGQTPYYDQPSAPVLDRNGYCYVVFKDSNAVGTSNGFVVVKLDTNFDVSQAITLNPSTSSSWEAQYTTTATPRVSQDDAFVAFGTGVFGKVGSTAYPQQCYIMFNLPTDLTSAVGSHAFPMTGLWSGYGIDIADVTSAVAAKWTKQTVTPQFNSGSHLNLTASLTAVTTSNTAGTGTTLVQNF